MFSKLGAYSKRGGCFVNGDSRTEPLSSPAELRDAQPWAPALLVGSGASRPMGLGTLRLLRSRASRLMGSGASRRRAAVGRRIAWLEARYRLLDFQSLRETQRSPAKPREVQRNPEILRRSSELQRSSEPQNIRSSDLRIDRHWPSDREISVQLAGDPARPRREPQRCKRA